MTPYHHGDLRRALVDAAADLLSRRSPSQVSLREVARTAGVSHAAPAHHFGDRLGLLTAVATRGFELLSETLEQVRSEHAADPEGAFIAGGRAYVSFAESHPGYFAVMFRADLHRAQDPDLAAAASRAYDGLVHMTEPVATAVDLPDGAWLAWAFVHGVATLGNEGQWALVADGSSATSVYDRLAPLVVHPLIHEPPEKMARHPSSGSD